MKIDPKTLGRIHFVGIGGIGMSGIAEILHTLGYHISGSDIAENANVKRLQKRGIQIHIGHDEKNVGIAGTYRPGAVVMSSAVSENNPEIVHAREHQVPVIKRAEMLAELMRLKQGIAVAGTHGKTTTTAMIGAVLEEGGIDPTVINGGIVNAYGTNTRTGEGDWIVVEADESDRSFLKLPATVSVVTNIDPEHLDCYTDFKDVKASYQQFVSQIPFFGFAVLCIDDSDVQSMISSIKDRRLYTYGFNPQADIQATNIEYAADGSRFDVRISKRFGGFTDHMHEVHLSLVGEHNIQNALAAITIGVQLGLEKEAIMAALAKLKGVKRRFTKVGTVNGNDIYDDYAHHPTEIKAVLKTARQLYEGQDGRIVTVFQPHRYSRLQNLMKDFCTCFNDSDVVVIADVYSAGEDPIPNVDKSALADGLYNAGHKNVLLLDSKDDLVPVLSDVLRPGDALFFMGAGDITQWANDFPHLLEGRMAA